MEDPLLQRLGGDGRPGDQPCPRPLGSLAAVLDEQRQEYQSQKRRSQCCCLPSSAALFGRCINSTRFCLVFSVSAVSVAAPWALASIQISIMFLVYFLAVSEALFVRTRISDYHYTFNESVEDILCLALLRGLLVGVFSMTVPGLVYRRPYLLWAIGVAALEISYCIPKIVAIRYNHEVQRPTPILTLCALHLVFSCLHVAAAEGAVAWARRRARMGLLFNTNFTYEHSETVDESIRRDALPLEDEALPPDADSLFFVDVDGPRGPIENIEPLIVHYKVAMPSTPPKVFRTNGIILIHSFGGGVHSWRHVMQPLADVAGVVTIAFDRPGFGLTSRPSTKFLSASLNHRQNPYSMEFHASLALRLARGIGLKRILICGTGDGAMIALMAAASASAVTSNWAISPGMPTMPSNPILGRQPPQLEKQPGNISSSIDLAWMGSMVAPGQRRRVLESLLRGQLSPEWKSGQSPSRYVTEETPSPSSSEAEDNIIGDLEEGRHYDTSPPRTFNVESQSSPENTENARHRLEPLHDQSEHSELSVAGVALLHPDISGQCGPDHVRVLSKSRLGRRALRQLLAAEIGDVGNPRAWAHGSAPPDVFSLYRRRLRQGPHWDAALDAVCTASSSKVPARLVDSMVEYAVGPQRGVGLLVVHGALDGLGSFQDAQRVSALVIGGHLEVLQGCCKLSQEEAPHALASLLARFAQEVLGV